VIKGVYHILKNNSTLTDIVGSGIFPMKVPQGMPFPAVVLNTDSTLPEFHKQASSELLRVNLQVEIYSDSYAQIESIKNACRIALDNYKGAANGETFQRIIFENESSNTDNTTKSGTITVEALYAEDGANNKPVDLFGYFDNATLVTVSAKTSDTGDTSFDGSAYITSLDFNGPVNETATFSATLEVTGQIASGTVA